MLKVKQVEEKKTSIEKVDGCSESGHAERRTLRQMKGDDRCGHS